MIKVRRLVGVEEVSPTQITKGENELTRHLLAARHAELVAHALLRSPEHDELEQLLAFAEERLVVEAQGEVEALRTGGLSASGLRNAKRRGGLLGTDGGLWG